MKFVLVFAFTVCYVSNALPQQGWVWDEVSRPRPTRPQSTSTTSTTAPPTSSADCLRNCLSTQEYNPVCGTDGITYDNNNKFNCARRCGADINIAFRGACSAGK